MNRYPLWKYILIAVALVVSVIYAAPNLFGEVAAVQISGVRASVKRTPRSSPRSRRP
jgi:preprotein translocase subunit SecD